MTIFNDTTCKKLLNAFKGDMPLTIHKDHFSVKGSSESTSEKIQQIVSSQNFCAIMPMHKQSDETIFTISPYAPPEAFKESPIVIKTIFNDTICKKLQNAFKDDIPLTIHKEHFSVKGSSESTSEKIQQIVSSQNFCAIMPIHKQDDETIFTISPYAPPEAFIESPIVILFKQQNQTRLGNTKTKELKKTLETLSEKQLKIIWESLENPNWFISDFKLAKKVLKSLPKNTPNDIWVKLDICLSKQPFSNRITLRWDGANFFQPYQKVLDELLFNKLSIKDFLENFLSTSDERLHFFALEEILLNGNESHIAEFFAIYPIDKFKDIFKRRRVDALTTAFLNPDPNNLKCFLNTLAANKEFETEFLSLLGEAASHCYPSMKHIHLILDYVPPNNVATFLSEFGGQILLNFIHYFVVKQIVDKKKNVRIKCSLRNKCTVPFLIGALSKKINRLATLDVTVRTRSDDLKNLITLLEKNAVNLSKAICLTRNFVNLTSFCLACLFGDFKTTTLLKSKLTEADLKTIVLSPSYLNYRLYDLSLMYKPESGCSKLLKSLIQHYLCVVDTTQTNLDPALHLKLQINQNTN